MLRPNLSKNDGCASETAFKTCVKSAPVEPSIQKSGIKGVSATCAIYNIDLLCFAVKPHAPEIGFRTCIAQRGYHSYIMFQRFDPSICYHTFMLVHFPLGYIHENYVHQFGGMDVHSTVCFP